MHRTPVHRQAEAGLYAIDLGMAESGDATAYFLGTIGAAGAQFTSAYVEWSQYPQEEQRDMVLDSVDITLDGNTITGRSAAVAMEDNILLPDENHAGLHAGLCQPATEFQRHQRGDSGPK